MIITYITSHFGSARDLDRCIKSVYKDFQTIRVGNIKLEHLIYLDGFKDEAADYQFLNNYPHLRIFQSHQSLGKSHGVNYLLSKAYGDYIFLLDSDDWNLLGRTSISLDYHVQNQNSTSLILGSNYLLWDRSSLFQQSHYPLDDQTIKLKFWAFFPFYYIAL